MGDLRDDGFGTVVIMQQAHALRQFQVAQVDYVAKSHVCHIDFDVFRQVTRQADDFRAVEVVLDDTARLDAHAGVFVGKVQADGRLQFLTADNALEVHVLIERFVEVALHVTDDNFNIALAFNFQADDLRIEAVKTAEFDQIVLFDGDGKRRAFATVNDSGHQSFTTQAAARTFPAVLANDGAQGVCIFTHRFLHSIKKSACDQRSVGFRGAS